MAYIIWHSINSILTFYLASFPTFFLPFFLAFILASILAFFLAFYLTFYSGILSGIYSDILFRHSFCHSFCHSFWHSIWHSFLAFCLTFFSGILFGIYYTGSLSDMGGARAHWVELAVEVWQGRGWRREEGRRQTTPIKSPTWQVLKLRFNWVTNVGTIILLEAW